MALSKRALKNRTSFRNKYSRRTARIVRLAAWRGWRSRQISERLEVPLMTVAATLANLTRGTYTPFADMDFYGNVDGTCRY